MKAEQWTFRPKPWSDEARVEELKKLWREGYSASQIADRMGGLTRNAVIGKINRLGLSYRVKRYSAWRADKRRQRKSRETAPLPPRGLPGKVMAKTLFRLRPPLDLPSEPVVIHEDVYVAPEARKGVLQLTESDCKWPIGDPRDADFHFCGGKTVPGFSYCEGHCRRAYQTVQEVEDRCLRAMRRAAA